MPVQARKRLGVSLSATLAMAISSFSSMQAMAIDDHAYFGQSMPESIGDLPPGLLRSQLENLPAPAKARALKWLQDFGFPAADVAFLRADAQGGIFYEDPALDGATTLDGDTPTLSGITAQNVFTLHSKPGASRVIYLDMDGHVVTGTVWNASTGIDPLVMESFDTDGVPDSFSSAEIQEIAETWKRVAEDYAPYDVDVTTEDPQSFGPQIGHILVSPQTDANGNSIYGSTAGGVAYVGVWGLSSYAYYQPALVFPEYLSSKAKYMAEAASHEMGHNLGLSHDGSSTTGYYQGHGTGYTDWAPIMGVGYYAQVTQWSKGEYPDANNQEDDLGLIAGRIGYDGDDHEDTDFNAATPLVRSDTVTIAATTPVTDPNNQNPHNKGVIGDRLDVDLFAIDVDEGTIDLTITPAWIEDFSTQGLRSANLDLKANLYDSTGNSIAESDPTDDTYAHVVANVPSGRYILAIQGVGLGTTSDGYSDYGSVGQYFIEGTIPSDFVYTSPPNAPEDLTASLNVEGNGILLSWTDPSSTSTANEIGYRVLRRVDDSEPVEIATLAQDSSFYADNNLDNGTYTYWLQAYNPAGVDLSNETEALTISAPVYLYATSEATDAGIVQSGSYLDTHGDSGGETLVETHQGGKPSNRVSSLDHSWTLTGLQPSALVTLEVEAEAPANTEGDDFRFSYSLNGGASMDLGVVEQGTGRQTLSTTLPSSAEGGLELHVADTDRSVGNGTTDSISVFLIRVSTTGDPEEQSPIVFIEELRDGYSYLQGDAFTMNASAQDYEDGDLGSSVSWTSDIDGHLHTGASFIVTELSAPLSIGHHQIKASVTDSAGNLGESTIAVEIRDPNAATMASIAALSGTSEVVRNKWSATVSATVVDDQDTPVSNATVVGDWSGAATGSASCITNDAGQCSLTQSGLQSREPVVTFRVTNVTHPALDYSANPDMESITVNAP